MAGRQFWIDRGDKVVDIVAREPHRYRFRHRSSVLSRLSSAL